MWLLRTCACEARASHAHPRPNSARACVCGGGGEGGRGGCAVTPRPRATQASMTERDPCIGSAALRGVPPPPQRGAGERGRVLLRSVALWGHGFRLLPPVSSLCLCLFLFLFLCLCP